MESRRGWLTKAGDKSAAGRAAGKASAERRKKPADQCKSAYVTLRLTPKELDRLCCQALAKRLSLSNALRELIPSVVDLPRF